MHPSDDKFLQSKLPQRKLEIALERLFGRDTLTPHWQKTYSDYIRTRIYPSLLYLAGQKDYERLQRLLAAGWADTKVRLRLVQEEKIKDVQVRAMLLTAGQAEAFRDFHITSASGRKQLLAAPALLTLWGRRLGLEHPALRNVLSALRFQEVPDRRLPGTDGETIYYHGKYLEELAASGTGYPAYLHMILHCLFFHILPPKDADRPLWDLSCDIAAEMLGEQMFPEQFGGRTFSGEVHSARSFSAVKKELRAALNAEGQFPLTSAPAVYRLLESHPERAEVFMGQLLRDDHEQWYQRTTRSHEKKQKEQRCTASQLCCRRHMLRQWAQAAHNSRGSQRTASPRFGLMPGSRQDRMEKKEEGQYNFGRYLKRFSVTGEEMQLDTDSFDYIPYHYGMEHYGNLPFLEPLEYTETNKVEELVIAIDTSGSCSLELVRRFLGETRKMLTEKEHFFARMRVHIFQCDSIIQDYRLIHSREEWSRYEDRLSVAGRGGTNFIPVFDRVGRMLKTGSIKKLKGLLYFSDGDGIYPRERPPYETAFIFPDFRFLELKIPEWVVKICIEQRSPQP